MTAETEQVQHTPGPWLTSGPHDGDEWWFGNGLEIIVTDARGHTICVYGANTPQELANARLIAATPDLLAALEELLLATPLPLANARHRAAFEAGRNAIRKARGEDA